METLRLLRKEAPDACCIVGNDGALISALNEGLADGVVSGVACVLPELILQIFENGIKGEFSSVAIEALNEFLRQLDKMPTPWGLKVMAEARGIVNTVFHGIGRDAFMARHRANHVSIAYGADAASVDRALALKAAMFDALGVTVHLCGKISLN